MKVAGLTGSVGLRRNPVMRDAVQYRDETLSVCRRADEENRLHRKPIGRTLFRAYVIEAAMSARTCQDDTVRQ